MLDWFIWFGLLLLKLHWMVYVNWLANIRWRQRLEQKKKWINGKIKQIQSYFNFISLSALAVLKLQMNIPNVELDDEFSTNKAICELRNKVFVWLEMNLTKQPSSETINSIFSFSSLVVVAGAVLTRFIRLAVRSFVGWCFFFFFSRFFFVAPVSHVEPTKSI